MKNEEVDWDLFPTPTRVHRNQPFWLVFTGEVPAPVKGAQKRRAWWFRSFCQECGKGYVASMVEGDVQPRGKCEECW